MSNDLRNRLVKESKRLEEDVLHSEKNHFVSATFWRKVYLLLGLAITILAAIAGTLALYEFEDHTIISAFFATIVAIMSGTNTFLNPNEKANKYKFIGDKYNALRNDIRVFREIEIDQVKSEVQIKKRLFDLEKRKKELNQNSLHISKKAYQKARRGIKEGEAEYSVDKES